HPAEAEAVHNPIQAPATADSASLAPRDISMNVMTAPVTKTIKATLTTVPTKSSMSSLPKTARRADNGRASSRSPKDVQLHLLAALCFASADPLGKRRHPTIAWSPSRRGGTACPIRKSTSTKRDGGSSTAH